MKRMLLAVVTGLLLAGLLVGTWTVPASAAVVSAVPAAPPPGFDPSSSKWREYMLNITGRVLGAAMPDKWRAEQIANQYRLAHSPDALAAATGIGRGNPLDRIPETIEDYTAQEYERQNQRKLTATGTGAVRAPATPGAKFMKNVGGVATAISGLEIGTTLGGAGMNLVGGWFGWDVNGTVCSQVAGTPGEALTSWVTGQDCEAYKLSGEYPPNADAGEGWTAAVYQDGSVRYMGAVAPHPNFPDNWIACYQWDRPSDMTGVGTFYYRESTGTFGAITPPNPLPEPHPNPNDGSNRVREACMALAADSMITLSVFSGNSPVLWFRSTAPGNPQVGTSPMEVPLDPERTMECTVQFGDGSSASKVASAYFESQGMFSPAECPATPEGKVPESVTITEHGNGEPKELYKEDTTQEFRDWVGDFPECADGTCLLDLVKITPGAVVSCFDLSDGCPDWFEDPNKTENYRCLYGSEDVGLAECAVYSGLFKPGRVSVGAPYSDPMTGEWSGGSSAPKPDQQAMGQTIQNPAATYRSCDGMNVTGFDPIGFVMRPIQCALEWAFVPRPLVAEASFAGVQDVWEGKPPGAIAEAMEQVEISGGATGCSISTTYKGTTTPLVDACGGFMAGLATFTRLAATALMAVFVFAQVRRQIAAMVNYNVGQD
jgi:hypothetical protein